MDIHADVQKSKSTMLSTPRTVSIVFVMVSKDYTLSGFTPAICTARPLRGVRVGIQKDAFGWTIVKNSSTWPGVWDRFQGL